MLQFIIALVKSFFKTAVAAAVQETADTYVQVAYELTVRGTFYGMDLEWWGRTSISQKSFTQNLTSRFRQLWGLTFKFWGQLGHMLGLLLKLNTEIARWWLSGKNRKETQGVTAPKLGLLLLAIILIVLLGLGMIITASTPVAGQLATVAGGAATTIGGSMHNLNKTVDAINMLFDAMVGRGLHSSRVRTTKAKKASMPYTMAFLETRFDKVVRQTLKTKNGEIVLSEFGKSDDEEKVIDIKKEEMMGYALNLEPSFVYRKGDEIGILHLWRADGSKVLPIDNSFQNVLDEMGVHVNAKRVAVSGDNKFAAMVNQVLSNNDLWTIPNLLMVWMDGDGASLGSGANKEIVETVTFQELSLKYDIDLETLIDNSQKGSGDMMKAGKYLGRLFRPYRYWVEKDFTVQLRTVKANYDDPTIDPDREYDGHILVNRNTVRSTGLKVKAGDRVEVTAVHKGRLIKGHATVVSDMDSDFVMYGDQTKTLVGSDRPFLGFEKLKPQDSVYLDIQSMTNLWEVFQDKLYGWAEDDILSAQKSVLDGDIPEAVKWLNAEHSDSQWTVGKIGYAEADLAMPWMSRAMWRFYRSQIQNVDKLRIRIPGAIARYATPDYNDIVSRGSVIIRGADLVFNREDFVRFAGWLHGGADYDDRFVIVPMPNNKVLTYRSPNQRGEWSVWSVMHSDHEFSATHSLKIPAVQKWNKCRVMEDQSIEQATANINRFWMDLVESQTPVESCLAGRVPKRIRLDKGTMEVRDAVNFQDGPLTELFSSVSTMLQTVDNVMAEYEKAYPVPATLLGGTTPMFDVAAEMRRSYGRSMRKLINWQTTAEAELEGIEDPKKQEAARKEVDRKVKARRDRIDGHVRQQLSQFTADEQKAIVGDLMHLCYVTYPAAGKGTKANDGILGIQSTSRTTGTADICLDILADKGLACHIQEIDGKIDILDEAYDSVSTDDIRFNQAADTTYVKTASVKEAVQPDDYAVTIVGAWRILVESHKKDPNTLAVSRIKKACAHMYDKLTDHNTLLKVEGRDILFRNKKVASLAKTTATVPAGSYRLRTVTSKREDKAIIAVLRPVK